MVRKTRSFLISRIYLLHMAAVASLCAGLVLLQHFCMNHNDVDFVASYCLTDSHMRAVLAAILTVIGLVLTWSVTSAVEAYRSVKLASGINEGVYIAMASQSVKYLLRALLTRWAPVVMLIVLCTNAPNSIQTLANLGIKTAGVYVQNPSTAIVFDHYSYYNTTVTETNFTNLNNALGVLTKMVSFRTSATSTVVNHGESVTTSVLRDAYVGQVHIVHSDVTNAFKHEETVATITSTCSVAILSGTLAEVVPATSGAVNLTYVSGNFAAVFVYDIAPDILSNNSVLFHSFLSEPGGELGTSSVLTSDTFISNSSTTACTHSLIIQEQEIIYSLSTDTVTPVRLVSNDTTVSASDLANLIVAFAKSVEATPEGLSNADYVSSVLNFYSAFPTSSFNASQSNVLHSKLCASTSLALDFLWSNYEINSSDYEDIGVVGNAFDTYDAFLPLYNVVQVTYISSADIAIIAGVLTGSACLVCLVGMFFAVKSRINVKPATDSSLLYNAAPALIVRKQALMSELSNDPHGQLNLEFKADSVLYCRELQVNYPDAADPTKEKTFCRVNITYDDVGAEPNKSQQYW